MIDRAVPKKFPRNWEEQSIGRKENLVERLKGFFHGEDRGAILLSESAMQHESRYDFEGRFRSGHRGEHDLGSRGS